MKNIKFLLAFILFSVMSCSNEDTTEDGTFHTIIALKDYTHSAFELELLNLVNEDRISKDLDIFIIINEISYLASTHDDYMIEHGVASHDNFEQRVYTLKAVLNAISVSENVAVGYNSPTTTLAAWNDSAGHRINLEGNYSHYGLAVKADANGKKYYTLLLIRK